MKIGDSVHGETNRPRGMHIFLDGRAINWTGIGTYIRNILERLPTLDSTSQFTVVINPGDEEKFPEGIHRQILKAPIPVYSIKEQLLLKSSFQGADLVHFPHFTTPLVFKEPYVVTIHDLVYFLFRNACPNRVGHWYARLMYPTVARNARLVITDSEFSKSEIVNYLGGRKERVTVIYPGVDIEHFQPKPSETVGPVLNKYAITRKYLLYVGNHQRRKNILKLIYAFAQLKQRREYQLIIGGPRDPRQMELEVSLRKLGLMEEVIFTDWIPLEELPALYSGASCFIFPSLYEGFGLPPLESMACGTPVVASNMTSIPEVVGDAGVLVDPNEIQSLREGIERVLDSEGLQEELRERGIERARQFSWDTTAKKTLHVYYEALNKGRAVP